MNAFCTDGVITRALFFVKLQRIGVSVHAVRAKENSILKAMPGENFLPYVISAGLWDAAGPVV